MSCSSAARAGGSAHRSRTRASAARRSPSGPGGSSSEACDERIAVGKRGELELPFDVVDDGVELRAPLAGVVAGLRAAGHAVCVFLPVDAPLVTPGILRALGEACREGARPASTPAPCAFARAVLPQLEARLEGDDLTLAGALRAVDTAVLDGLDEALLVDTDHPHELARLERRFAARP